MKDKQTKNPVMDVLSGIKRNAEPIVCLILKKRGYSEAEDYQTAVL
jgi:hypothetical protein